MASLLLPQRPGELWTPGHRSIANPIPLGVREEGSLVNTALWTRTGARHLLITGSTGAGKTNTMNVLLAGILAANDSIVWVIDVAKHGKSLAHWLPCIDWMATRPDTVAAMLTEAINVISARSLHGAQQAARGHGEAVMRPRPTQALLSIIIDEASAALNAREDIADMATQISETGREVGVQLIIGAQKVISESLGDATRLISQLNPVICLRMNKRRDYLNALGVPASELPLEAFTVPGVLLYQDGPDTDPLPVRSFALYEPSDARRIADAYAPHRPKFEPYILAALSDAYHQRDRDPLGVGTLPDNVIPIQRTSSRRTIPAAVPAQPRVHLPVLPTAADYAASSQRQQQAHARLTEARSFITAQINLPDVPATPLTHLAAVHTPAPERVTADMLPSADKIMKTLAGAAGPLDRTEIATLSGYSRAQTYRALNYLENVALVQRGRRGRTVTFTAAHAA